MLQVWAAKRNNHQQVRREEEERGPEGERDGDTHDDVAACMSIDVVWHAFAQSFFTLEIHDLLTGPLTFKAMILLYRVA